MPIATAASGVNHRFHTKSSAFCSLLARCSVQWPTRIPYHSRDVRHSITLELMPMPQTASKIASKPIRLGSNAYWQPSGRLALPSEGKACILSL